MQHSKEKLSVGVLGEIEPQAKLLIERTIWGAKGGLRYHNKEINWARLSSDGRRILAVNDAEGETVLVLVGEHTRWGFYLAAAAARVQKASVLRLIREEIRSLTPDLSSGQTFATIIVSSNRAAVWAAKLYDLEEMATLESIPFTRRWPKASARCRNMAREERAEILSHLESMGRSWQDAETSLIAEEYFVYEENGRIVAGVQACPQHLLVASLGSKLDRITFAIMPLVLGKSADDFHLVQLHHAWGKKEVFDELWSHVLHAHGVCMAHIAIDLRDRLFAYIRHDLKRGLASRIAGIETMAVFGKGAIPSLPIAVAPVMSTFV